jgi:hypothetical protein
MTVKRVIFFRQITGLVIAITLHLEFWLVETSINHLIIEKHTEASSQVHVKGQSNKFQDATDHHHHHLQR